MAEPVSIADAKSRISELVGRVSFGRERFVIRRHGRPVAALVSTEDLRRLEANQAPAPGGLLAAVGALADVDDLDAILADIQEQRAQARDREVNLE